MEPWSVSSPRHSPLQRVVHAAARLLASLKLAVLLMVLLAAVLAVATVLETRHGTPYAHWFVYKSSWFSGLLALLGVNIFFAAAVRYPWKRHQTGFVVTHIGLLVLLAGSIQSTLNGVEGRISLTEGETTSHMTLPEQSQISAVWAGRPKEAPYEFLFNGGPADWTEGVCRDVGEVDGVHARVTKFYRHAEPITEWVADPRGGPVVKFRVTGPDGKTVADNSLADEQFGDALLVGPIRLQLQTALGAPMLADFLTPNTIDPLPEQGRLLMYYHEDSACVAVQEFIGQQVRLGGTGVQVEIVKYLPNAQPDKLGQFSTKGDQPRNPMVELLVHLPGAAQPIRQIAFAKDPLLNLDGVYPQVCPVKFCYQHPNVKPAPAFELMQAADGALHGRFLAEGQVKPLRAILAGDKISLSQNFELTVLEHTAHARRTVRYEPVVADTPAKNTGEPAALVELSSGGHSQQLWLRRNDPQQGLGTLAMPQGAMIVRFESAQLPLGYSLKLEKFQREVNPGGEGNAAFASRVQLVDPENHIDEVREISMNQPLTHRRFTIYQSGFDEGGHNKKVSAFNAAYDPGRTLKYLGSLMVCLGIATMFYMRAYFFKRQTVVRVQTNAGLAALDDHEFVDSEVGTLLREHRVAA